MTPLYGGPALLALARQPTHGQEQAGLFVLASVTLLAGVFLVATAFIPTLHKWMLNDEIYNSGKRLPPGYREYMTRLAPKMGAVLILLAVALAIYGAVS